MDVDDDALLVQLGRRARERQDELGAHADDVPALAPARRRALLDAIGVDVPVARAPEHRPRRARVLLTGGLVALVAALAIVALRSPTPSVVAEPPLAVIYDLELAGGRAEQLAAPLSVAVPRYHPGDVLVVRMRPRVADPGARVLSLRARPQGGGAVLLVPALVREQDGGMLELRAPIATLLPLVPGRWQLEVGVGLPGACEQDSEDRCTWASRVIEIVDGA